MCMKCQINSSNCTESKQPFWAKIVSIFAVGISVEKLPTVNTLCVNFYIFFYSLNVKFGKLIKVFLDLDSDGICGQLCIKRFCLSNVKLKLLSEIIYFPHLPIFTLLHKSLF